MIFRREHGFTPALFSLGLVFVTFSGGADATVTAVDIDASNGVIHVIDTVLLPPSS
jgi:uncharacterized surface protein with fasciclin (FAS1) repeats